MGDLSLPRFLAVDDDPGAQRTYRRLLRKYGDVVVADGVAAAKKELNDGGAFDVFLFDLRLGDGSGLELLKHARHAHPSTPTLLLTGHVEGWVVNEAFDLGAETLAKPFEAARLFQWVERVLGLTSAPVAQVRPPAALSTRIEMLRELLRVAPLDNLGRYRVGTIIAELKAQPEVYGNGAVQLVATALGQDEASLYRHARVAERWSPAEFEALMERRMRDGSAATWSHLVVLATVESKARRQQLLERLLGENLSVRRLEEVVRELGDG
ncbi:MAG TPA: response regulator [Polyangiaceae bacterium]